MPRLVTLSARINARLLQRIGNSSSGGTENSRDHCAIVLALALLHPVGMKLAVAVDYDGTIAFNGTIDPAVRDAIAQLRLHAIAVVLVTGRRLVSSKT